MRETFVLVTLSVAGITLAACAPGPLAGPVRGAPLGAGAVAMSSEASTGDVETIRRRLAGTWDLVSLEASPEQGGPRTEVTASGTLVYDDFGNLTIDARTTDPDVPAPARDVAVLAFKGRAVIDAARHELQLTDLSGNVDPGDVLSPERRRRYAFDEDRLTLTSFDARGQITAIAVWKRRTVP